MDVHWNCEAIGIASERFKRPQGVGASPKGHDLPVQPYDSWRALTPFLKGRLLEGYCGGKQE
jgi:hypothetical protein